MNIDFFFTYTIKQRPHVIFKIAASLDGKIATVEGDTRWITSESARKEGHRWRNWCDAICVGSKTILADNPKLTCRIRGGRDPLRIVLDTTLKLSTTANVLNKKSKNRCLIVCGHQASVKKRIALEKVGAEVLISPKSAEGINLHFLLTELAKRGITSLLLEGGAELAWSFLFAGLLDEIVCFFSPRFLGGVTAKPIIAGAGFKKISEATKLELIQVKKIDKDLYLRAKVVNDFNK